MSIKFSFNKNAASSSNNRRVVKQDPRLEARDIQAKKISQGQQRRVEKIKQRNAQVSEPFIALVPHATRDESHYEVIHRSLPGWSGQDEGGNPKAKMMKDAVDRLVAAGKYRMRWAEPKDYGNVLRTLLDNQEQARSQGIEQGKIDAAILKARKDSERMRSLAPQGMPVYEPIQSGEDDINKTVRRLFSSDLLDQVIARRSKEVNTTAGAGDDFFEILKGGGARSLMRYALRGEKPAKTVTEPGEIQPSLPDGPNLGKCMECNLPFINEDGNKTHVSNEEYSQLLPGQRQGVFTHRFASPDLPDDRDDALQNSRIGTSSVLLGKVVKIKTVHRNEISGKKRLKSIPPATKSCPTCNGSGNGEEDNNRNNVLECSGCKKDLIKMKQVIDGEGNTVERPYSIGLGEGKIKYFDIADVPDGDSRKVFTPGTPNTALGAANCEHGCNDGNHDLTPKNICSTCNGTKRIPNPELSAIQEDRFLIPVRDSVEQEFSGNPIVKNNIAATQLEQHSSSTHGYASQCHPDCAICHGEETFQQNGKPCPNRIARFDEEGKFVSPPGVQWIKPDGSFEIPSGELEKILTESGIPFSMRKFGQTGEESIGSLYDTIKKPREEKSPISQVNSTVMDYNGRGVNANDVTGTLEFPLDIPESVKSSLRQERERINSSPNARLTGSSQQLEAVVKAVRDGIGSFPMHVENKPVVSRRGDTSLFGGRLDPDTLHPSVREHVPAIEQTYSDLGHTNTRLLDDLYQSASNAAKKRAGEETPQGFRENAYRQLYSRVLDRTDNHPSMSLALGNLPVPLTERELGL